MYVSNIVLLVVFALVNRILSSCIDRQASSTCLYTTSLPINGTYCSKERCMPAVGNGYIGTFIMSDEIHVGGVYNGKANVRKKYSNVHYSTGTGYNTVPPEFLQNHTHRARIPSTGAINFTLNSPGDRRFALDVQHGVFYQWFNNSHIEIEQRTYAHHSWKNILVVEIEVSTLQDFPLELLNNRGNESVDMNVTYLNNDALPYKAMLGKTKATEVSDIHTISVAVVWTKIPQFIQVKKSNKSQIFRFITAIVTSMEDNAPMSSAITIWNKARRTNNLFDQHKKSWSSLWNQANITVGGNQKLSQVVFSSLYNILSSIRKDWLFGISPGSIAGGEEYLGHVFWDQDVWMYPTILMLYPELAKSLLQYRYLRLEAAKVISKAFGFQGAMYPWESAAFGVEVCPFKVYGKNEIHITGDIVFAIHQYFLATGDIVWISKFGIHVVIEAAKFWSSRVVFDQSKNAYVINDVMPPDEYQYPVNNSYYTNVVAKINFEVAIMFGKLLNISTPNEWKLISENIYLPYDEKLDYHPEFEGFNVTKKEAVVKQADVILTNFPLMFPMKNTTVKNDLEFYADVTDPNGPAMTHSMFTIGYLQTGNYERAEKSFTKNFENINGPFRIWSEVRLGRGARNFITAAGGFLQSLVFGYGGIRLKQDGLHFNLHKPANTSRLEVNGLSYKGNRLRFISTDISCLVELTKHDIQGRELYVKLPNGYMKRLYLNKPSYSCIGVIVQSAVPTPSSSASKMTTKICLSFVTQYMIMYFLFCR